MQQAANTHAGAAGGPAVVELQAVSKRYGPVRAVQELNLSLRAGEIYGFVGLNGAGKTTSIRMMLGLIRPDGGTVRLFGEKLGQGGPRLLGRVGCLVESASAYPNLSVRENLELQRRVVGGSAADLAEVVELLGLGPVARRRAGVLSLGNRQRLSLARALLGGPECLILDEPVNGLDPAGIVEIRALLRRLARERGMAILMSSHLLDEVEQLADRIGIIHQGVLVEETDRAGLAARRRPCLEIEFDDPARGRALLREAFPGLGWEALDGRGWRIRPTGEGPELDPAGIARTLVLAGIGLRRLSPVQDGLEEHFMALTGGKPCAS